VAPGIQAGADAATTPAAAAAATAVMSQPLRRTSTSSPESAANPFRQRGVPGQTAAVRPAGRDFA
jgi:hypothetical protein